MSDTIIAALIGAIGSIIGALIGALATLWSIKLTPKKNTISDEKVDQNRRLRKSVDKKDRRIIAGGFIGALLVLSMLILTDTIPLPVLLGINVYDDFNDNAYDENINTNLWATEDDDKNYVKQRNGALMLTPNNENSVVSVHSLNGLSPNAKSFYVEGKVRLESNYKGSLFLGVAPYDGLFSDDIYYCRINNDIPPEIYCAIDDSEIDYVTQKKEISFNSWHKIRIEIFLNSNVTFYIDDKVVGKYEDLTGNLEFVYPQWSLNLSAISHSSDFIGFFDDIRIRRND